MSAMEVMRGALAVAGSKLNRSRAKGREESHEAPESHRTHHGQAHDPGEFEAAPPDPDPEGRFTKPRPKPRRRALANGTETVEARGGLLCDDVQDVFDGDDPQEHPISSHHGKDREVVDLHDAYGLLLVLPGPDGDHSRMSCSVMVCFMFGSLLRRCARKAGRRRQ
jgi:hypothetical protein